MPRASALDNISLNLANTVQRNYGVDRPFVFSQIKPEVVSYADLI